MSNEEWRPVKGYEGYYEVSNLGRVKSLNYRNSGKEGIFRLTTDQFGYKIAHLCVNYKNYNYRVHRMVAEAFIPNPNNYKEINHKDEDKANNHVDNLEWCSRKYNVNYGRRTQKWIDTVINSNCLKNHPKKSKTVYQFSLNGAFIAEYPSTREVERLLGYDSANVGKCCNGKHNTAYGYRWSYNKDIIQ